MQLETFDQLLAGLFVWLNKNKPIKKDRRLEASDVAYMSLTQDEFAVVPGSAEYCTWRRVNRKIYKGIEFWESEYNLEPFTDCRELSRRIAWKLTSNTMALFSDK